MAQLFKPYANVVAKASIVLGGAIPLIVGLSAAAYSRSPYNTKVEVPLNQPIPFSLLFEICLCSNCILTFLYYQFPNSQTVILKVVPLLQCVLG